MRGRSKLREAGAVMDKVDTQQMQMNVKTMTAYKTM